VRLVSGGGTPVDGNVTHGDERDEHGLVGAAKDDAATGAAPTQLRRCSL
jgi:hypothetical protein